MFRREWVEIHICSSGENWLSNWQWRAVVRFANVCWGVGLGKEPWGARQTVKSWMLFAGLLFYCLFVQTKERHCLRCGPQFNAFVGVYQRKKLLTRKIFVKFSCRPRTDGKKVSFYKWRGLSKGDNAYALKNGYADAFKRKFSKKIEGIFPETVYWREKSVLL